MSREFLNKQTKILPDSDEWSEIEYSLQISIGSTCPVIKQMWSVASPQLTTNFDKKSQMKVVDCWVNLSHLGEENRLEDTCKRGFKIPKPGLVFTTGSIKLPEDTYGYSKTYEYLFCKVAVGKSYCVNMETLEGELAVPEGYESILLYNSSQDDNTYNYSYLITHSEQILPCFLVQFELDPSLEEGLETMLCDICQESQAAIYCQADDATLCMDCDDEHHNRGNKLMQRHKRIPVNEKPKRFGNCRSHPDMKVEFFCTVCYTPVCVNCKMIGSHSTPETSIHTLIRISDAYSRALAEAGEPDPVLENKKTSVSQLLNQIDKRITLVKENAKQVEDKLYAMLQEALVELQMETQKKVSALVSAEVELKRELEMMSWVECFLRYEQEVLSPANFMLAWGRHMNLRNRLKTTSSVQELSAIEPDIKVEGSINVVSEAKLREYISQPDESSVASSTPRTGSSRFRTQLFNRYMSTEKPPLKGSIPAKPMEILTSNFKPMLKIKSTQDDSL